MPNNEYEVGNRCMFTMAVVKFQINFQSIVSGMINKCQELGTCEIEMWLNF